MSFVILQFSNKSNTFSIKRKLIPPQLPYDTICVRDDTICVRDEQKQFSLL